MEDNYTNVAIADLMGESGVKFGTSGARGLVQAMTDRVCYAYTAAFLQALEEQGTIRGAVEVGVAGDLRPSTPRITRAVAQACLDKGHRVLDCGKIPTPAVTLFGLARGIPTVMVTGSHIPDDRNGIKFNKPSGEILKADEATIKRQTVRLANQFTPEGMLASVAQSLGVPTDEARSSYLERWLRAFAGSRLRGKRIVVYRHSAVGRDLVCDILTQLGAEVVPVGSSEVFVPVDTEAIRNEDVLLAAEWARKYQPFAIVSTDGDSDRPLIADEQGVFLRGDVAGLLCAKYLGADVVVTPVSSNTAVEKSGLFRRVIRTRIGSPYVIEAMERAAREGGARVSGYEANGGFLTASTIEVGQASLSPLPTRDAIVVLLAVLSLAADAGVSVSKVVGQLPGRFTASDRLKDFPSEQAGRIVLDLSNRDSGRLAAAWGGRFGRVTSVDTTDGVRMTLASDEIIHLRASGNAPELRCYAEASSDARAREIAGIVLGLVDGWRREGREVAPG